MNNCDCGYTAEVASSKHHKDCSVYKENHDADCSAKNELKKGIKFDDGKLRLDLIPTIGLLKQAEVYSIGSRKYGDNNWRAGIKWSRIIGAMMRHLIAFASGESVDPEDGQHHLASVAWGANTLMEYEYTHTELDDRSIVLTKEQLHALLKKHGNKTM